MKLINLENEMMVYDWTRLFGKKRVSYLSMLSSFLYPFGSICCHQWKYLILHDWKGKHNTNLESSNEIKCILMILNSFRTGWVNPKKYRTFSYVFIFLMMTTPICSYQRYIVLFCHRISSLKQGVYWGIKGSSMNRKQESSIKS